MKYIRLFLSIILSVFILTSCKINDNEFIDLVKDINEYNESIKVPDIDLSIYTNGLLESEILTWDEFQSFSKYRFKKINDNKEYKEYLKEDINLLFKALRSNYGLYNYFGGDINFNLVKEETLAFIDSKEILTENEVVDFISGKLSFIKDKHFYIGSRNTMKSNFMYVNNKEYFKDESGYYKFENNKKYYIESIDGDLDIEKYIKPSIGGDGQIIYVLYKIIENEVGINEYLSDREVKGVIKYIGESKIVEDDVFSIYGVDKKTFDKVFKYEDDSVPIITIRAMDLSDEEDIKKFVKTAIESKKSKVTVLDLRDNIGGNSVWPVMWIKSRTNKLVKSNSKSLFVQRLLNQPDYNDILKEENSMTYEYLSFRQINDYYYEMDNKGDDGLIKNKNYIFVIVDNNTASAGEFFIDLLKRLENVIIIGSNTNGVLNGSIYDNLRLPNTGISFGYGNTIRIYDKELFEEGRGFMPDIIVNDDETLEKVLKLIQYYNLN